MGPEWIPALVLVAAGACIDLRTGAIPNWLTIPGFLGGVLWHGAVSGPGGFAFAVGGAIAASLCFFIPYARGGMGGGDVKLFMALGAFLGPIHGFRAALCTALVGGGIALGVLWVRRRKGRLHHETRQIPVRSEPLRHRWVQAVRNRRAWGSIPYGPAIALGTAWSVYAA